MNKTGFALLSKEQLEMLYGPKSPYADKEVNKQNIIFNQKNGHFLGSAKIHGFGAVKNIGIH
jgi:hypothetical protein